MDCESLEVETEKETESETETTTTTEIETLTERDREETTTMCTTEYGIEIFKVKTLRICSKQKSNKNTFKDTHLLYTYTYICVCM